MCAPSSAASTSICEINVVSLIIDQLLIKLLINNYKAATPTGQTQARDVFMCTWCGGPHDQQPYLFMRNVAYGIELHHKVELQCHTQRFCHITIVRALQLTRAGSRSRASLE